MPILNITIKNRIAYADKEEFIVGGNEDYKIVFHFDSEWDNILTKTARFSWNENSYDEIFTGNECNVPRITNANILKVGVFVGNKRATTDAFIPCKISTVDNNGMPPNPEEDVYSQILEKLDQAIGEQTAVPKGGKEGQVLGKKSDKDFDTKWVDMGGGTNVEANPTEGATEDLSKLKVGETVYNLVDKTELDKKLDKDTSTSTNNKVYIKQPNGTQATTSATHLNTIGYMPYYSNANAATVGAADNGGTFAVAMPKQPYQPTPKKYVDDNKGTKLYRHTFEGTYSDGDAVNVIFSGYFYSTKSTEIFIDGHISLEDTETIIGGFEGIYLFDETGGATLEDNRPYDGFFLNTPFDITEFNCVITEV